MKAIIYFILILITVDLSGQYSYLKKFKNKELNNESVETILKMPNNPDKAFIMSTGATKYGLGEPWSLKIKNYSILSGTFTESNYSLSAEHSMSPYGSLLSKKNIITVGSITDLSTVYTKNFFVLSQQDSGIPNWIKVIGDSALNERATDVILTNNKENLAVCGYETEPIVNGRQPRYAFIYKFDLFGNVLWKRTVNPTISQISGEAITSDKNNNLYLLSLDKSFIPSLMQSAITKYTAAGDSLWTKYYKVDVSNQPKDMKLTEDDHLVISSSVKFEKYDGLIVPILSKLDLEGTVIWHRNYYDVVDFGSFAEKFTITNDGGFAMCVDRGYPCLIVTDNVGEPVFVKHFDSLGVKNPRDIIQLEDGSFLIIGYISKSPSFNPEKNTFWVLKTDAKGEITSTSGSELQNSKIEVFPNPSGDFVQIDFQDNLKFENLKLVLVSSMGTILKEKKLQKENQINIYDFPSGNYYLNIFEGKKLIAVKKIIKM